MDPQKTLAALLDAYRREDRDDVEEYLMALLEWNNDEGFHPVVEESSTEVGAFLVRH